MGDETDLIDAAGAELPATVELRRELHRHPELGNHLPRTQGVVLDAIGPLGLDVRTGESLSSVIATLDTGRPGGTMLLRGDMDALPMEEDTDEPFRSEVAGAMHACGHDAHTAMLVSAARLLVDRADQLTGKVVFMFQPGEEGHHGARVMLEEGLLDGLDVTRAFAIHQSPSIPSGMVATRGGPILASADVFTVTVRGAGAHASMPHHGNDPVPVACAMVGAFQTMVTRRVDVFDPAVVTVARVRAGSTNNVIPETAELLGTIRTTSERARELVQRELTRIATGYAEAHGMTAEVDIERGYPVTVNDHDAAAWVRQVAGGVVGPNMVIDMPTPVMGAEDWSYVLQAVPGAMAFLGTCPPQIALHDAAPNHSNRMVIDEGAMAAGVALHAAVALDELAATRAR
ncbi:amidohydrolase [Aquihabitans sp. G128]|uniref:M20 metallopeptidase family protein n=1 Tax=Aquihabitans sp. G128 TaxID=2849779 RepID=UPI001C24D103|nr:M20 family metallopeptidase [Aquihabitans sp. G128]QXC59368.1 amidohydrolase [Aquihabitans sp. G128]